jgi:hypothetical protein
MSRISLLVVVAFAAVLSAAAPASAQIGAPNTITIPVVSTGTAAVFNGTFTLRRFVATADGVAAVGLLTGVATPTGGTPTSIVQAVVVPARVAMQDLVTPAQIAPPRAASCTSTLVPCFSTCSGCRLT